MAFDCAECDDTGVLYPLEHEEEAWPHGVPCFHCERGADIGDAWEARRQVRLAWETRWFAVRLAITPPPPRR